MVSDKSVLSKGSSRRTYLSHRTAITRTLYGALLASFGIRLYRNLSVHPEQDGGRQDKDLFEKKEAPLGPRPKKVEINLVFSKQSRQLLRIAFPRLISIDTFLIFLQAMCLIGRTCLSLSVARLDGQITAHLVKGEGTEFLKSVAMWMVIGLPASMMNASIQFLQKTIALRVRSNLTDYALNRYLVEDSQGPVYYRIQMDTNSNVNVGQLIAADTAKFASALPRLYANSAKPLLDVVVYSNQSGKNIGADNVFFSAVAIQLSARFLRLAAPPFGEFVATEAKLEGDFRQGHNRLIEYAEEVAFYSGDKPEKQRLDRTFYALVKHINMVLKSRLAYSSLEDFVIKYWWGAAGLISCSIPVFGGNSNASNRAQNYVVNRKSLSSSSDAVGRIMSSYKEISSLAGIVSRVSEFIDEINKLNNSDETCTSDKFGSPSKAKGVVEIGDYVEFDKVPITSPSGEVLVKDSTFRIDQGHHLLIVGPNGSGKSSLFRILGGIWPLLGGRVVRPHQWDVFYIPQRPYLSKGSLRQQIIYPESETDTKADDQELINILKILGLDASVESETDGLNAEREWRDDLSAGAQQKIAAARLFYHRPKFAILDECTASVTLDTETTIYTHAKALGISLLTVSHRASLWQYHDKISQFDGQGGYIFADLNPAERSALEEEKLRIDYQLRQVGSLQERLLVLEQERARRGSRNVSRRTSRMNSRESSRTSSRQPSTHNSRSTSPS